MIGQIVAYSIMCSTMASADQVRQGIDDGVLSPQEVMEAGCALLPRQQGVVRQMVGQKDIQLPNGEYIDSILAEVLHISGKAVHWTVLVRKSQAQGI